MIQNEKNLYVVVLSGGSGTKLWPKSTPKKPKQLCGFGGSKKTLLEQTLDRLDEKIPVERRVVVTQQCQLELTQKVAGNLCKKIIPEPQAGGTVSALAFGVSYIRKLTENDPKTIVIRWHADHQLDHGLQFW